MPALAFDRSLRSVDADGHMRVEMSRISKANVCPYKGSEIPRAAELGLDPNKIYWLLRDPRELERGADTFTGKPLLIRHVPINADLPSKDLWVGTVGSVSWEDPYLVTRPLTILTQEAIDLIESEEQRELSAGYRYDAEMTPGWYGGRRYDGRMVNIRGNHVAIVSEGRVGPDVHVADESPPELSRMSRTLRLAAALAAVTPFLAPDVDRVKVALALDGELGETPTSTGRVMDEDLDDEEKKKAEDAAREEKGMDASEELSDEDKEMAYNKAKDKKAKDRKARDKKARDKKAADKRARDAAAANLGESKGGADDVDHRDDFNSNAQGGANKSGHDEAITMDELNETVRKTREETLAAARSASIAWQVAREAVRPILGIAPFALDTAEKVYAAALKQAGIDVVKDKIDASAYPAMLDLVIKQRQAVPRGTTPTHALDASGEDLLDLDKLFKSKAA